MKITNRCGLPEAFVRAVTNDGYNNHGTLSVTTLIRPAHQVQLEKKHWDEIEEDAADRVWSLFGQAGHAALERTIQDGDIVERRLHHMVGDVAISGQLDRLTKDGVLADWKFISVYSAMDMLKNGVKQEYELQLNMLAALVRLNNSIIHSPSENALMPDPKALRIIAVCRDWRPSEAKRMDDYPPKVSSISVPMWPHEKAMEFIKERVRLHTSTNPPVCTREERWYRPGKWAVMEKGKKKALRLCDTKEQAEEWKDKNGGTYIEEREPVYPRCDDYCTVSIFCKPWQDYLASKLNDAA